jgi:flagellar hook-associated protein 3 FlgL
MRISTQMMQRLAVSSILDRQSSLSQTQQQLATGRRILTPAEDPAASTQALMNNQKLSITTQYQSNADRALSRLQSEESILVAASDSLQRIRELAIEGLNEALGQDSRDAIAAEVEQRLSELFDLANSKDGSGEYLFSGFQGNTQPFVNGGAGVYTYQGDQGQRQLQISPTRQMATSDPGSDLFVDLPFSGGGTQNIFKTVYDYASALNTNTTSSDVLDDIDAAMDKIFSVRAEIGGRINSIDSQKDINEQYSVQLQGSLSDIQDLDYADAIGRLNLQLTGLQAAQQSFQKIQSLSLFNYL